MKRVADSKNRKWELLIDAPNYRRIKEETGIDITLIRYPRRDGSGLSLAYELVESAIVILDIAWALCEPQAHKQDIDRDEFDRVIAARLPSFRDAIIEEVIDFFRLMGMQTEADVLLNLQPVMQQGKAAAVKKMMTELGENAGPQPTPSSSNTPDSPDSETISVA